MMTKLVLMIAAAAAVRVLVVASLLPVSSSSSSSVLAWTTTLTTTTATKKKHRQIISPSSLSSLSSSSSSLLSPAILHNPQQLVQQCRPSRRQEGQIPTRLFQALSMDTFDDTSSSKSSSNNNNSNNSIVVDLKDKHPSSYSSSLSSSSESATAGATTATETAASASGGTASDRTFYGGSGGGPSKSKYTNSVFSHVDVVVNTNAKGVDDTIIRIAQHVIQDANANANNINDADADADAVVTMKNTGTVNDDVDASETTTTTTATRNYENNDFPVSFNVHITSTQEEAQQVAKSLVLRHHHRNNSSNNNKKKNKKSRSLVIPVGGDGTVTNLLQWMYDATAEQQKDDSHQEKEEAEADGDTFPFTFAYVAMGTGNALGSVVGCKATTTTSSTIATSSTTSTSSSPSSSSWARKLLRTPRRRKYDSFQNTLQQIFDAVHESNAARKRRTTSSSNSTTATTTARKKKSYDTVEVPLMRVVTKPVVDHQDDSGRQQHQRSYYSFFAGVGFDSLMLQDYQEQQTWTKQKTSSRLLKFVKGVADNTLLSGVPGYTTALFTRTLPKCLPPPLGKRAHLMRVQITTNQPSETCWVDHRRGDFLRPILEDDDGDGDVDKAKNDSIVDESGEDIDSLILYEGKAGIVASSTVPYYGGGLRLFPFARMAGNSKMHLRVGRIHPFRGVLNIPRIFRGSYREKRDGAFGCLDFIGPSFSVRILNDGDDDHDNVDDPKKEMKSEGYPVQHSGESIGASTNVMVEIARKQDSSRLSPIKFLTLLPPRPTSEDDTYI